MSHPETTRILMAVGIVFHRLNIPQFVGVGYIGFSLNQGKLKSRHIL
jgi:hypothetical protein